MLKKKTLTAKVYGTHKLYRTHKRKIWHKITYKRKGKTIIYRGRRIHKISTTKTVYEEKYFIHAKTYKTLKRRVDQYVKSKEWTDYEGDLCYDERDRKWKPCEEIE